MTDKSSLYDKRIASNLTRMISLVLAVIIVLGFLSSNMSLAENASVAAGINLTLMTTDVCGYVNVDPGKNLNVRNGPGTDYEIVGSLPSETVVQVVGEATENGRMWYYIGFATESAKAYGYCSAEYIGFVSALDDPDFEILLDEQGFPENYRVYLRVIHHFHPSWIFELMDPDVSWDDDLYEQTQYKESYIPLDSISSWKSTKSDNYNWDTDKYVSFEGTKTNASEALVAYYIDPRNFLNDVQIFQFEKQTYSESLNNEDIINKILYGTFMYCTLVPGGDTRRIAAQKAEEERRKAEATATPAPVPEPTAVPTVNPTSVPSSETGSADPASASLPAEYTILPSDLTPLSSETAPAATETPAAAETPKPTETPSQPTEEPENNDVTYAEAFIRFGQEFNVSPLMLAARVRQEQGVYGTNKLISGTVPGHEGYYNYFNIGASGSTPAIILENGMIEAESEGWTTHYLALEGGSKKVAANYISKGQDTIYLQKFDLDDEYYDRYWHQYMQNIQAPTYETRNTLKTYKSFGIDTEPLVFKIPILKNMPSVAAPCPTNDGNPNFRLKSITINGKQVDDFKSGTFYYFDKVGTSASAVTIGATPVNSKTKVSGTGKVELKIGENKITVDTVAENGDKGQYTLIVTRLEVEITPEPTMTPSPTPTLPPTARPTVVPTLKPTATPTLPPTATPTAAASPTAASSDSPVITLGPTEKPTQAPTASPTAPPEAGFKTTYKYGYNKIVDKDIIYGIEQGTGAGELKNNFILTNAEIGVYDSEGKLLSDSDRLSTGCTVWIFSKLDGGMIRALNVVIFGDVDGNGDIDEFDFVFIKRDVWDIKKLEGLGMVAGAISSKDPTQSSAVNEFDFVYIKRHVWGIAPITQSR